jgi:hypothetical protein
MKEIRRLTLCLCLALSSAHADVFDEVWGTAPKTTAPTQPVSVLDSFISERQAQDEAAVRQRIAEVYGSHHRPSGLSALANPFSPPNPAPLLSDHLSVDGSEMEEPQARPGPQLFQGYTQMGGLYYRMGG